MTPLKSAWHHIRRSPIQSLTAIIVMTVSFFGLNIFVIFSSGMSSVLKYFESKPEVTIFLKDGLDRNTVENLQKELSNYPDIREIKFISKEKALTIYKEQNKSNPLLTEMVTSSVLPASFEVSVSDPKILEEIAQNFTSKKDQVDEIIYQKDIIQSLINWTNLIRKTGVILVGFGTLISFIVISIIIGMKITNRKEEIRISRLLGASKFYVKKPFLIEGLFYGLFGGIVGSAVSISLALYFRTQMNQFFQPIIFLTTSINFYLILLATSIISGSLLGYLASWLGAKRYIKY
ncbi:permease-like cell division protein FtsX [Candidatus Shapirobacteria bacterium]|nr:permease-like cell division protein FtsX [Candidatus Shapirobacteria bacterium]